MLVLSRLFPESNINWYLLFHIVGIIACLIYYILISRKFSFKWYVGLGLGVIIVLVEMIGAKLLAFIELGSVDFSWSGGFSLFGGIFLLFPALLLLARFLKINTADLLDFAIVGCFVCLGFFRLGCLFAGCCYGIAWPWGISDGEGGHLFPVQLIEVVLDFLAAAVLFVFLVKKKLPNGCLYGLGYLAYGIIRFVLQFFRERTNLFWAISLSHIWALIVIIAGIAIFLYFLSRQKRVIKNKQPE